jgi:DNA-binding transcriptional regulator YiaG
MIDLAAESLLTLEQAGEMLMVSKASLYRWITQGTKGVRLEAVRAGGRWRTSVEALQRFSDALTPNQDSSPSSRPHIPTSRQRQRHLERVERELDELLGGRYCETCRAAIAVSQCVIPKNEKVWCPQCLIKRRSATMGKRIRTFRWAASLSQQKLSECTGITVDNIRAYEFDDKKPSDEQLAKLIGALGGDLVTGLPEYSQNGQRQIEIPNTEP